MRVFNTPVGKISIKPGECRIKAITIKKGKVPGKTIFSLNTDLYIIRIKGGKITLVKKLIFSHNMVWEVPTGIPRLLKSMIKNIARSIIFRHFPSFFELIIKIVNWKKKKKQELSVIG